MEQIIQVIQSRGDIIVFAAIFMSVALITFAVSNIAASWSDVRRRAVTASSDYQGQSKATGQLVREASQFDRLSGLMPADEIKKTALTRFLNSAGYYGNNAVVKFQLLRIVSAVTLGMLTVSLFGRLYPNQPFIMAIAASLVLTLLGYMLPRSIVSMQRDKLVEEHRQGFPDFLDLLVICVEAGIGIDSAIERISRDLAKGYPSLARNLGFMSLELRAGQSTREALENLGGRLGISEAKSFATLIQQSEELGTSLVQSLRVYSDDMRDKRLSRAEEKAHSLPVKLVLPLALFIFPVILGVTLMPVAMKLYKALGI